MFVQYHPFMTIDQIAIALLGAAAAFLSQASTEAARRWACIFGIVGQPFWFWASWHANQWGVFAVSVLYALAWVRGFWLYWVAPRVRAEVGLGAIPKSAPK